MCCLAEEYGRNILSGVFKESFVEIMTEEQDSNERIVGLVAPSTKRAACVGGSIKEDTGAL